jgi:hypothetical protein
MGQVNPKTGSRQPPDEIMGFLCCNAPLLEEKWDFGLQTLIPKLRDPFLRGRIAPGTTTAWIERYNSCIVQESNHVYSYCI